MIVVVPQRPQSGEEAQRGVHGVAIVLREHGRRVAIGVQLLSLPQRAQLAVVEQRAAGVTPVDVTVFVGDEERGELGPHALQDDRVVIDDRTAALVGDERHVPERIGGDLLHVHQPLERLHSFGAGWQQ